MARSKLTQRELGELLGISQPMVSRLVQFGMPLDLEGARAWRLNHLDPSYTVDYRRQRQMRRRPKRPPE